VEALTAWLTDAPVTHVAMESTGVYWRPVYAVLEPTMQIALVNARAVKHVPGRKTDVRDSEWLAQLLECGLLKASFIPPPLIRDLRDLTRYRKVLIRERGQHVNRVEKTLELAQIKLSSVVTDLMGHTGRAILAALMAGETDPARLAGLAKGLLKKKRGALQEAVRGGLRAHYAVLIRHQLARSITWPSRLRTSMTKSRRPSAPSPMRATYSARHRHRQPARPKRSSPRSERT
jgi:transposase